MLRFAAALALLATPAVADVTVSDARLVAAFANAKAGALYLTLESDAGDMLIGVHTPDAMAMLHESVEEDGVMRMAAVEQVAVQAGEPLAMKPGGLHIMVMGITPEMLEADRLPISLIFKDAGEVAVEAHVHIGIDDDADHAHGADGHSHDHAGGHHGEGATE